MTLLLKKINSIIHNFCTDQFFKEGAIEGKIKCMWFF